MKDPWSTKRTSDRRAGHAHLLAQSLPQARRRPYASGICDTATGSSESAFRNPQSPKNTSFSSPGVHCSGETRQTRST
eukprot:3233160-Alexandrium_andersonii.AAC.1